MSRRDGLLSTELPGGEVVVYDPSAETYNHLSPTCGFVWLRCDGEATVEQLTDSIRGRFQLEGADDVVGTALAELRERDLLAGSAVPAGAQGYTRRDAIQRMAAGGVAAALLPVVTTLAFPRAAHASGVGTPTNEEGGGCTPGYWMNHLNDWPISTTLLFSVVFGVDRLPGKTLIEVISPMGSMSDPWKKLAMHATAALLNAEHADIFYPFTPDEIKELVQDVDAGLRDAEAVKNDFDKENNSNACVMDGENTTGGGKPARIA